MQVIYSCIIPHHSNSLFFLSNINNHSFTTYHQGVKDHFVLLNEKVLREHDSDAVDEMLNATNLQELVDAGVQGAAQT